MDTTIAITGATGFAGDHAVSELVARGYRLRALVRDPARARLPASVAVIAGDLFDGTALDRLLAGADGVLHLAGAISALRPHDFFRVNAHGTVALAEAARRHGVGRFVHVSSLSAREPQLSAYGASKRAGEEAVAGLMEPLNAVILRPPAVYGPGDRATLPLLRELTKPVAVIPGRRDSRFSLIHAADLARLCADALETDMSGLHEISDGTPGGYGWDDLMAIAGRERGATVRAIFLPRPIPQAVALAAEAVARISGKPGMVSRGKIAELYHPDWVARDGGPRLAAPITFAKGLPETLAWYRQAGWLPQAAATDRSGAISKKEAGL